MLFDAEYLGNFWNRDPIGSSGVEFLMPGSEFFSMKNPTADTCYAILTGNRWHSCLVSYDHISQRILKLAQARDILGNLLATLKAQTV